MPAELQKLLEQNKNIILGMASCPFCIRAAELLMKKSIKFLYIPKETCGSIDEEVRKFREGLPDQNRRRHTYPAVFIDGEYIGGCDDLVSRNL